jgi:uncharacterized protein YggE
MEAVMRKIIGIVFLFCFGVVAGANAQDVVINRQNRTVDVTVTASVSKFADLAEMTFSCDTKSPTDAEAYQKNIEKADKVVKALLSAGVPKTDIVTAGLSLQQEERSFEERKANPNRAPLFEAYQSWTVRVAAADAQRVIDSAVRSGAHEVNGVTWLLSNPDVTESQARIDALRRAHATASEIATGLGGKLGEPVYVSNQAIKTTLLERKEAIANVTDIVTAPVAPPGQTLQLFPERIEKQATVRVVFALD